MHIKHIHTHTLSLKNPPRQHVFLQEKQHKNHKIEVWIKDVCLYTHVLDETLICCLPQKKQNQSKRIFFVLKKTKLSMTCLRKDAKVKHFFLSRINMI